MWSKNTRPIVIRIWKTKFDCLMNCLVFLCLEKILCAQMIYKKQTKVESRLFKTDLNICDNSIMWVVSRLCWWNQKNYKFQSIEISNLIFTCLTHLIFTKYNFKDIYVNLNKSIKKIWIHSITPGQVLKQTIFVIHFWLTILQGFFQHKGPH